MPDPLLYLLRKINEYELKETKMHKITNSTSVAAVGTDSDDLIVEFVKGSTYRYEGAAAAFDGLLDEHARGRSVGRYLNANVKAAGFFAERVA